MWIWGEKFRAIISKDQTPGLAELTGEPPVVAKTAGYPAREAFPRIRRFIRLRSQWQLTESPWRAIGVKMDGPSEKFVGQLTEGTLIDGI